MQYLETVKEKKYKPLFGYGYEPRPFDQDLLRTNGNDTTDVADVEPAGAENGFDKPEGNPLMGVVIAVTLFIALFLIAVILSLRNEPETVRKPAPSGSVSVACSMTGFHLDDTNLLFARSC